MDLCVFNRLPATFTVSFTSDSSGSPVTGTLGSPIVPPGDWYCGYNNTNWLYGKPNGYSVYALIQNLPTDRVSVNGHNNSEQLWLDGTIPSKDNPGPGCFIWLNQPDEGSSAVTDSGSVGLTLRRENDEPNWKKFYVFVELSQGRGGCHND